MRTGLLKEIKDILLRDDSILEMLNKNDLNKAAEYLHKNELSTRRAVKQRYKALEHNLVKKFTLNDLSLELHFNPGRIASTSAKTDKNTIMHRECFLCYQNIPPEQKGILIKDYILLVNPFPLFPDHFTIVKTDHTPQLINGAFEDLLTLAKSFSPYLTLFYNGPECGASAPDHLHFQGGTKGYLPLENEIIKLEKIYGEEIKQGISALDDGYRKMILIKGTVIKNISTLFMSFMNIYEKYSSGTLEPLLNILVLFSKGGWKVVIFLREKHRPAVFFSEGDDNFLVSPAAADLSGTVIAPLRKDFDKAEADLLGRVFREVSLNTSHVKKLKEELLLSL